MEKGFFSPAAGYWQTTDEPSDDIRATFPPDTVEVPLRPSAKHVLSEGSWLLPATTQEEVDAELAARRADMTLTFSQLIIGLVAEGWITEQQGDRWLDGVLPEPVLSLIATLHPSARFAARARAKRPSVVLRSDALVVGLGAAQGKTPAQLDVFFETYALV